MERIVATAAALVIAATALSGCSGTAVRSPEAVMQSATTAQPNDIFLYRQTGPFGAASLLRVSVNGKQVGTLGEGASLRVSLPEGSTTIDVGPSALAGIGTRPARVTIDQMSQGPRYFKVSAPMEGLVRVFKLTEIERDTYLARLN